MKKFYLLISLFAACVLSTSARSWDFTKWSAETQANLMAGAFENANTINPESGWSDVEKTSGTAPTALSKGACFWEVTAQGTSAGATLTANGVTIKELEGLLYMNTTARSLAIALNYQNASDTDEAFRNYHGASYLWLGSSKKNYLVIPNVPLGTTISMGVESHKTSDSRGVNLYAGSAHSTSGTLLKDADGNDVPTPTTYQEFDWYVPEELTEGLNEDGTVDVLIYNTNGCHIYFIKLDDEEEFNTEDIKVAYLYDATYNTGTEGYGYGANGGLDEDPIFNNSIQSFSAVPIDIAEANQTLSTDELNDSLINFDVVVLSEAVGSGNKYAKALNGIINFVPMLNLKAFMYKNWGYGAGSNPSTKATTIKVNEDYIDSELFADIDIDDEGNIALFDVEDVSTINSKSNLVQGYTVTAGTLFADDEVIATVSGINAIHAHGTKNQYMLIPLSSDNLPYIADPAFTLVYNAVTVLAQTKSKVQNAAAPVISQKQTDGMTTVSITCTTAGATIYYTVDGTEPTEASTVYGEAFDVTEDGLVVKAFATAHGYNPSSVSTATVSVQNQAAAPTISVSNGEGFTTLTLSQSEDAVIYYTFSGVTTAAQAATYTEPIVVTEPGTIYAFSAPADKLASELVAQEFVVAGIPAVKDTVAHFTANQTDWFDNAVLHVGEESATVAEAIANSNQFGATGTAKAIYYFGKKEWNYYDTNKIDSTVVVKDEEGNVLKTVDGQDSTKVYYHRNDESLKYITSNTDAQWVVKSYGQVITGETSEGPLQGVGNGTAARYADAAIDEIGAQPSKGFIDFGGKASGEPYSMSIESTEKFAAGEYDVVVYLGNGSTGSPIIALQTSADGENWTSVMDTLNYTTNQRYYKKTRKHLTFTEPLYIRVTQTSGSSKGYIYDIYVITTDGLSGIQAVEYNDVKNAGSDVIYNLFGQKVGKEYKGIVIKNGKKVILK